MKNRKDKIAFLRKLEQGKESVKNIVEPIHGILFCQDGEVFAYRSKDREIDFNPGVSIAQFDHRQYPVSHEITFENFKQKDNAI